MRNGARRWPRRLGMGAGAVFGLVGVVLFVVFRTDVFLSSLNVGPLGTAEEAGALLSEVAAFHGAPSRWFEQPEIEAHFRGSVPFTSARLAFGLDVVDVELTLRFSPGLPGRYEYVLREGQNVRKGHVDTRVDRDAFGLLLDSVRHLFELPFTASSIPYRRGLPHAVTGEGRAFFTWGEDPTPTSRYDQIVLWSDNGHLIRMDTTGRDIAPFIVAQVDLEGVVEFDDFRIPKRVTIADPDEGHAIIHQWELSSIARSSSPREPMTTSRKGP